MLDSLWFKLRINELRSMLAHVDDAIKALEKLRAEMDGAEPTRRKRGRPPGSKNKKPGKGQKAQIASSLPDGGRQVADVVLH